jgi:hypothetical protein
LLPGEASELPVIVAGSVSTHDSHADAHR